MKLTRRQDYDAACAVERELWAIVKGLHPGQPGHNPEAWRRWLEAADRVRVLAKGLQEEPAPRKAA